MLFEKNSGDADQKIISKKDDFFDDIEENELNQKSLNKHHIANLLNNWRLGPQKLFVLSFLSIIFIGSFLLMLPEATLVTISYVDALFTATSAVCVTGLNVVNTELTFTFLGQCIILLLIQIGGLGIMTFTTYFSYFFTGKSSFKSLYLVKDITSEDNLNNVFSALKSILIITFIIEGLGAVLIFFSLTKSEMDLSEKVFFSIFHSVASFCNAGFSTLSGNLHDIRVQFNYPLHLIISFLIIFGGLGFPIIHNLWKHMTVNIIGFYNRVFKQEKYSYKIFVLNINSLVVIVTTVILIMIGTIGFYILEMDGVLTDYPTEIGKWATAFFESVTTRTAGFNSTDTGALSIPTTLLFIVLMWIGASPASTGGGIKTSTFAVAVLNFIALVRGKKNIEIRGREVSQYSVSKAFAQMSLAILFIMSITLSMIIIEADKDPLDMLFETVSAYCTVGLSRNITPSLSESGKLVITLTMFVGRVTLYTLLVSLIKRVKSNIYRYPTEEILIN